MSQRGRLLGVVFLLYVFVVLPLASVYVSMWFTVPAFFPGLAQRPHAALVVSVFLGALVPIIFAVALPLGSQIQ